MTRQVTELQGTALELVSQLQDLRSRDAIGDEQRKRANGRGTALVVAGSVGIFVGCFLHPALLVLAVGLMLASIPFFVKANKLQAIDLDNDRLALIHGLLDTLGPDFSEKKPLALTLRHGNCFDFGSKLEESRQGSFLTGTVQASEYEDPWLTLSGRFQDGSLFKLCATQSGKRKRKPKRKYTKIKDRVQEEVSLVLRVSPEVYPHLERLQASLLPERLRHSARLEINAVQVEGPVVRVRVETGPFGRMVGRSGESTFNNELKLNGEKVIGLFAFLFAGLSHCRVDAPAQSRQA